MTMTRLRDRLQRLEAQLVASPTIDWEVERTERLKLLECLTTDGCAMALYHEFLQVVSDATCPHRSIGACWPCVQRNEAVTEAHFQLQQRLVVASSLPNHQPKKEVLHHDDV